MWQVGQLSIPELRRVEPVCASAGASHFLHQVEGAAGTIATLAIPKADELETLGAKAYRRVEHPQVELHVRILARGLRAQEIRHDMKLGVRLREEVAPAPFIASPFDGVAEERRFVEGDVEGQLRAA